MLKRIPMPANPGSLVYGTILVAAILAAESGKHGYARTLVGVTVTIITYWIAVSYAEFIRYRIRREEPFSAGAFQHAARQEFAVVYGAAGPLAVVLICWAVGATLTTAVTLAIWFAVAIVVISEILIGLRAELTGRQLVVQSSMGMLLGALVIALRVLLH